MRGHRCQDLAGRGPSVWKPRGQAGPRRWLWTDPGRPGRVCGAAGSGVGWVGAPGPEATSAPDRAPRWGSQRLCGLSKNKQLVGRWTSLDSAHRVGSLSSPREGTRGASRRRWLLAPGLSTALSPRVPLNPPGGTVTFSIRSALRRGTLSPGPLHAFITAVAAAAPCGHVKIPEENRRRRTSAQSRKSP